MAGLCRRPALRHPLRHGSRRVPVNSEIFHVEVDAFFASAEQREAARDEWHTAAAYIASIHGKLKLKIEHDVRIHEVPVPEAALPTLAQMRRDVLMAGTS